MARLPYEAFDHTADIGLHASGRTLPELFSNAAAGMESLMVAPQQVRPLVRCEICAQGHDLVPLLIAWLNELIFQFDTAYLLFTRFEISDFADTQLRAVVWGEPYDPNRHELSSAMKAATWHEACVEADAEGYTARVIFDI